MPGITSILFIRDGLFGEKQIKQVLCVFCNSRGLHDHLFEEVILGYCEKLLTEY